MCGICGVADWGESVVPSAALAARMTAMIVHRGPDAQGVWAGPCAALGHARLSIVDPAGGAQPMAACGGRYWIVFNGEIYNHLELRPHLERLGHRFRTRSDTEVLIALYAAHGPAGLHRLNGQFAFAVWDGLDRRLFLARDRFGVRPLYYAEAGSAIAFASEVKSLFAVPGIEPRLDPAGLDDLFTFWSPQPPRTAWAGIEQLPPGHYLVADARGTRIARYWDLDFSPGAQDAAPQTAAAYAEELRALLADAVRLRMRADVPVGAYLSGGLDSSLTAALIRRHTAAPLSTFSIRFEDPAFDEGIGQAVMQQQLGTEHHAVHLHNADIAALLPDALWHIEQPMLRTAPVPLFRLSKMVHELGFKVVVTGEGADELFAGYNLFKEAKLRRFWARHPASRLRPLLLDRIYPYVARGGDARAAAAWRQFFARRLGETGDPCYSHRLRWDNAAALERFLEPALRAAAAGHDAIGALCMALPEDFALWDPLSQAQYLEVKTFLDPYLLCAQGDRVAMAHAVEGRFPFLDHRVAAFAARVPPRLRLRVLEEKYLVREAARGLVPEPVRRRPKQPYRAPIASAFRTPGAAALVREMLSEDAVAAAGYFNPAMAAQLAERRFRPGAPEPGERDQMALAAMLGVQLLHAQYAAGGRLRTALAEAARRAETIPRVGAPAPALAMGASR